jgi:PAT family beta-lactamase induction signal transducer AmpG
MGRWLAYARLYRQPKVLGIMCLGFSSGLPFLLTLGTLHAWLKSAEVSNTVIGYFALATIPYMFKFLWAPLTDHIKVPFFTKALGQRRGWIFASQIALVISLILLGLTNPHENIYLTGLATFGVSFCASCQDNGIEAYRIESLPRNQLGPGASASVLGFRLGMWVSGGGALYLAHLIDDWSVVYGIMSLCVMIGMLAISILPEPQHNEALTEARSLSFTHKVRKNIIPAFLEFGRRPDFFPIIIFIFLFKIGDTVLNMISIPFLIDIGFSNLEIANIAKTFGIGAMITGGLFAGMLQIHKPPIFNLAISISLLVCSSVMFMIQAHLGHNTNFLILTMGVENFACGMSATALIAYLSTLCRQPNTATHFAILSSFCSFSRIGLSIGAGWLADKTDWITYFAIIGSLSMLGLIWLSIFGQQIIESYRKEPVFFPAK